ncbi:hypothetical protein J6590_067192 [Homalodisca vitripennis]|nr:hypothetical protein J6590_067192 [Homalodisca vitripennis]
MFPRVATEWKVDPDRAPHAWSPHSTTGLPPAIQPWPMLFHRGLAPSGRNERKTKSKGRGSLPQIEESEEER